MLPTINEFVSKYGLENFVVVADSGLMNNANIAELEAHGYKYIIGAKIKNESQEVKNWILEQPKRDCQMVEYDKGGGRRLLVGYTDDRAKKDAYNREKGIRRLEKAYKHGALTKGNINKRGYNKFLSMELSFTYPNDYGETSNDWINITVRPSMDNTVACLKDLGLITDRDLVTREAMEKMNNRDYSETVEYAEKMEQENSTV